MRIHLSSVEPDRFYKRVVDAGLNNHLYSFFVCNKGTTRGIIQERWHPGVHIFLDSGGFPARMRGVQIDVKEYCTFINENWDKIEVAPNLDTNDVQETLQNQAYLTANSKARIMPVYHVSDYVNPKYKGLIDDFIAKYDYIGVGGMAGGSVPDWKQQKFLSYVFSKTRDRIKVHGFGITSEPYLTKYPFFSVDSTSWQSGMRWGHTLTPEGKKVSYRNKKHLMEHNVPTHLIQAHYLDRLPYDLQYWKNLEKRITELWKMRGVNWDN